MTRSVQTEKAVFTAKGGTGTGNSILIQDYEYVVFKLATASNANFTIKFQGSNSETAPDFSAAQTVANHWDYIATIDYLSGSVIAGGTGYSSAGTDVFKLIQANTTGLKWVCATITARSAGTITVTASLFAHA